MSQLAFFCTNPAGWDPICRGDQLLMLLLAGAVIGAVIMRLFVRRHSFHIVVLVLLYTVSCLVGAVAAAVLGIASSG